MTPAEWAIAIGSIAPLFTAVITQAHWSSQTKQIIALVFSVLVGVAVTATTAPGAIDWHNLLTTVPLVVAASQAAYSVLWKPTNVAPAIEKATAAAPVVRPARWGQLEPGAIVDTEKLAA